MLVPRLIADAGEQASPRFLDFFTAKIRNPNARRAYARAALDFSIGLRRMKSLSVVRDCSAAASRMARSSGLTWTLRIEAEDGWVMRMT